MNHSWKKYHLHSHLQSTAGPLLPQHFTICVAFYSNFSPACVCLWPQCLLPQFYRIPFPAHGRAGSPRWHALRTFRHIPPQPLLASQLLAPQLPVALGVGRFGAKSQPARGAVFQRLHALLRESAKAEPRSALRGLTGRLQLRRLSDFRLSGQTVTAVCASYDIVIDGQFLT